MAGADARSAEGEGMTETRTVEKVLRIEAPPEIVWRYWTDPTRMAEWWGPPAALDARPGGSCVVEMGGGPVMRGEYIELVPFERLVFTFGWDPMPGGPDVAPGSTRVEVLLAEQEGDTLLTLRHTGLPAAHADEHDGGWGHFLAILAERAGAAA
jgi:uncharacterized protein YndB with AHSA1/START domain